MCDDSESTPNALFAEHAVRHHEAEASTREDLVRRYAFAIPTDTALGVIAAAAPSGVVEIGAGTGYWARLLDERGVDVVAYDPHPAPSPDNPWFAGSEAWFPVRASDHRVIGHHGDRALLLVWPTRNETWPLDTLDLYAAAGGRTVIYVGEGPGGSTGDDAFQSRLGELQVCQHCRYRVATVPCICHHPARWRRTQRVELPHWPGCTDDLSIYEPAGDVANRRSRWRRR